MSRTPGVKVLQVTAVDSTVRWFLMPLIDRLGAEGYDVHVACSPGKHLGWIRSQGVTVHAISIKRTLASTRHVVSLLSLWRLMRRERFDIVHVHTPVAAVLGRIAARWAGVPRVIYTAHGFYFHENMVPWMRRLVVAVERWLGRWCTDHLFTQSREDWETAIAERIAPQEKVTWIGNGVDLERFTPREPDEDVRTRVGLTPEHRVIGFVGRMVREKGIYELLDAMEQVARRMPEARLLLVGARLNSDRDRRTSRTLEEEVVRRGLEETVLEAGFQPDVVPFFSLMDLYVLPSYREGMPRTVIEAMASGKPVIVTDIRGCREEVLDGVTGYLVPVRDGGALASAIEMLLSEPERMRRMGAAGRRRAEELFAESDVLDRQMGVYRIIGQ